jgi:hypothetical protein
VTWWTGFHPTKTNAYPDIWDECCCSCLHNPPAPIWPTQCSLDMGCNLRPLYQWGDATPPISAEELVPYKASTQFSSPSCHQVPSWRNWFHTKHPHGSPHLVATKCLHYLATHIVSTSSTYLLTYGTYPLTYIITKVGCNVFFFFFFFHYLNLAKLATY